ncbi:DUF2782 domain-containing protein [Pseudomonas typographi]|uniref:DUF2782 domain-containing protein n=1 Tax=Pseudomonas typographi TaxID=2715964 RepID=A0ABR7Z4H1_9PSED|nr:DUF2782 domain-containing protein [Pseudomonas typographi]MBD1552947.1 DUF2782 domain-containing protein [Pseudomonas typographi]MBD1588322.1 DUF2782 domain-containing protein [Pseudomonas typographi]MBD1600293.1 DUF2782 domain-containing protein [Pseudomonas typographi]
MRLLPCLLIAVMAFGATGPALAAGQPPMAGTEVTTYDQGAVRIQEFRVRGQLYRVKVIPKHGVPYNLVRADGSGDNFIRTDQPGLQIPQWTLLQW